MMKTRLVALVVALVLLMGMALPAMAIVDPYNYVALGDSIAAGYGLDKATKSYPVRLAGLIGATGFDVCAASGMSSAEVLAQLSDPSVMAKIAEAELVTVSAGCADLLGVFLAVVKQAAGTEDYQAILADPAKLAAVQAALASATAQATFTRTITGAATALAQIDAGIKLINPQAKVVYTGGYNPYAAITMPGFELGTLMGATISAFNMAIQQALPTATIVNLEVLFNADGAPNCVNASISPINMDPHPNAVGHARIAAKIHETVKASFPAVRNPALVAVTSAKVSLYKAKSTKTGKLETLSAGSSLLIYRWDDTWAKVGRNKGYAYVKMDKLVPFALLEKAKYRTQVTAAKINIRTAPSTKSACMAKAYRGNQLVAYSWSGKWAKVQYNGVIGYVETKYLKKV